SQRHQALTLLKTFLERVSKRHFVVLSHLEGVSKHEGSVAALQGYGKTSETTLCSFMDDDDNYSCLNSDGEVVFNYGKIPKVSRIHRDLISLEKASFLLSSAVDVVLNITYHQKKNKIKDDIMKKIPIVEKWVQQYEPTQTTIENYLFLYLTKPRMIQQSSTRPEDKVKGSMAKTDHWQQPLSSFELKSLVALLCIFEHAILQKLASAIFRYRESWIYGKCRIFCKSWNFCLIYLCFLIIRNDTLFHVLKIFLFLIIYKTFKRKSNCLVLKRSALVNKAEKTISFPKKQDTLNNCTINERNMRRKKKRQKKKKKNDVK
ncbi:hypothetical protein RFI_37465, partial [Reticulomyxa filosa]